jgi:hypothetical protein
MRALKTIGGAIVLAALLAPAARGQDVAEVKRLTILTFNAPVQLPGMTLPAGKYRFEMADINRAPHVVRVLSEDGLKVLGTFSTTPTTMPTRDLRDTDTVVMFAERPAGQPQAAKEWYYPQRSIGEEFIYPRAQAAALAAANHTSVASEDNGKVVRVEGNASSAENTTAAATTGADANAQPTESKAETEVAENRAPAQAAEPTAAPEQNAAAQPAPAPASAQAPASESPRPVGTSGQSTTPDPATASTPAPAAAPARTLPRTASQLSLFALLSGLSIAGAFGVRHLRNRATARG